jgi:methylated-DNA-[protein]-cysteine S-methyltransferase
LAGVVRLPSAVQGILDSGSSSTGVIAQQVDSSLAVRAIGMAASKNPIPIFIPCHRVIGFRGNLTGYRGGVELKAFLLKLERRF